MERHGHPAVEELEAGRGDGRGYASSAVRRGGAARLGAGLAAAGGLVAGLLWLGQVAPSAAPLLARATPPESGIASRTASPTASPPPLAHAQGPMSLADAFPYPIAEVPEGEIRTLSLPIGTWLVSSPVATGARLVFVARQAGAEMGWLFEADLSSGQLRMIDTFDTRTVAESSPQFSGDSVVWVAARCRAPNRSLSLTTCLAPIDWQIERLDLGTGRLEVVVDGQSPGTSGSASGAPSARPVPPVLAVDGDRLVYAEEVAPQSGKADAWQIVVRSLARGMVERTILAGGPVTSLAVSGDTVAFSQVAPLRATGETWLLVSTATHPEPLVLASGASAVAVAGHRLAWATPASPWLAVWEGGLPGGPPPGALRSLTVEAVAPPALAGTQLSWADRRGLIAVADLSAARTIGLHPPDRPQQSILSASWLSWTGTSVSGQVTLSGLPLADLPWPRPTTVSRQVVDARGLPVAAPGRGVGRGG